MGYEGKDSRLCAAIESARDGVAKAEQAYSKGAGCEQLDRARQRLHQATSEYETFRSGRVPNDKY
jgi:hypothetical protein